MLVEDPGPWGGLVRLEWVACWFSQRKMIEVVTEIERLQFFFSLKVIYLCLFPEYLYNFHCDLASHCKTSFFYSSCCSEHKQRGLKR